MKKLILALLAMTMVLGSLRVFAEVQVSTPSQQFDIYKDSGSGVAIALLPLTLMSQIEEVDKTSGSDADKASQIADLMVQLVADTTEDSFCAVAARVSTSHMSDLVEKDKLHKRLQEGCRSGVTQQKILKYLNKPYREKDINASEVPQGMANSQAIRLAYSQDVFLLMLKSK